MPPCEYELRGSESVSLLFILHYSRLLARPADPGRHASFVSLCSSMQFLVLHASFVLVPILRPCASSYVQQSSLPQQLPRQLRHPEEAAQAATDQATRYRTCTYFATALVVLMWLCSWLPIFFFSRGPPAPSFDAVLAAVMPARMLPGVV
jgi:hypothetical protein